MTAALVVGLMVGGLVLIAIEIFVIPGFGVIGVLGIAACVGSAYLAYSQLSSTHAAIAVAGGVVSAGVMFWILPKTKMGKAMVLETQTLGTSANPELKLLVDREGVFKGLRLLRSRGHDVMVFHVMDDDELHFPFSGPTRFDALESDQRLRCNPRALREGYLRALRSFLEEVRRGCAGHGVDYTLLRTGQSLDAALVAYLSNRMRIRSTK